MRLLFVIESLGFGGAEILLKNISFSLGRLGIDVEFAYLFAPGDLCHELESHHVPVHFLDSTKWGVIKTARKLSRLIAEHQIDIVHAHLFHAGLGVAFSKCLGNTRPTLVTFHNEGYDAYPPRTHLHHIRRYLDGLITRTLFDRWLANSAASADSARRHLHLPFIDVVPNGIDLGLIDEACKSPIFPLRDRYPIPDGSQLIVLPGRLVWEKGHRVFLKAWPKVIEACPSAYGMIVGNGPLQNDLARSIDQMGPTSRLKLVSRLAQRELYCLLRCADVVAIPSYREGYSLLIAEVMGLGVPIICTSAGGILEALGDENNAEIVPIGDAEKLADGIIALLFDKEKRQVLGKAGRARALRDLSIEAVAQKHLDIYHEVLETK